MSRRVFGAIGTAVLALPAALRADVAVQTSKQANTVTGSAQEAARNLARLETPNIGVIDLENAVPGEQGGVAGIGVTVCANPAPAQCQLPDQNGHGADGIVGVTSDANPAANFGAADNFILSAGGTINTVCWWGFYRNFEAGADCGPGAVPDAFTITYWANEPDCPDGAPAVSIFAGPFNVTGTLQKVATGNTVAGHAEFSYTATHPNVVIAAAECTWIEIQNNSGAQPPPPAQQCFWLWSTAPPGDGDSHQFNGAPPDNDFDMAFCLNGSLGAIADACLPPVDAGCVGASGPCGQPHAGPGCENSCCCTLVCQQQPLCCLADWTQACASAAIGLECAVFPLCQASANCQVYGDLNAISSTTGTFTGADDFTVTTSGAITTICWQGAYSPAVAGDNFTVRYYEGDGKFPGSPIAQFSQSGGTLPAVTRNDTALDIIGTSASIFQYTATHAAVNVTAGNCYWIEIANTVPAGTTWFWELAEEGVNQSQPSETLPREGNGRLLVDGAPLDGYGPEDVVADFDFSFCIGKVLATPACDFLTVFDTGPHQSVMFNPGTGLTPGPLGFSSGNLDNGATAQRRTAQAFSLPALPAGQAWKIDQVGIEGFEPGGFNNEFIHFEIHARTALNVAPTPASLNTAFLDVPVDTNCGPGNPCNLDPDTTRLFLVNLDTVLPPGNYWLTVWASNDDVPFVPSNFAWYTNAPDGINNSCGAGMGAGCAGNPGCPGPAGVPAATWRACTYPGPGFLPFKLPTTTLNVDPANDPTPDPADLLNTAMILRGQAVVPAPPCPWDCAQPPNGVIDTVDFLALLQSWGVLGGNGPCDFDSDGVINTVDFLALLQHWGPCP